MSYKQLGRPLRRRHPTPVDVRSWEVGVSAYATLEGARRRARAMRELGVDIGAYIAALLIPEDGPVTYEKTGGQDHYDLVGDAEAMLRCVESVVPV